jgi:mannan endo-1,4-beta-mannosidase
MCKRIFLLFSLLVTNVEVDGRLSVNGTDLFYNGQRVFLSGVNLAWNAYGYDFGNNQYVPNSKATFELWLTKIAAAGGNSVRIWLHVEGDCTPEYDTNGFVTAVDGKWAVTMLSDMKSFLDLAQSNNILVVFVLWNGAVMNNENTKNLVLDDLKLQSYIDQALKPMVAALGDHPALAAWEIMNEPEGSLLGGNVDANPCFDTTILSDGWTNARLPMQNVLRFINWQASAIKEVNSAAMVTLGSVTQFASTDAYPNSRNYYKDECLIAAGGKALGTLDFYQIHTYSWEGKWGTYSPFTVDAPGYQLDKPLVIGECASSCSEGETIEQMYQYAYDKGYQGVWSWQYNEGGDCADSQDTQDSGMKLLQGQTGSGIVDFPVN